MTTKDLSLTHLVRPSSLPENAPLILMLHGYGSDEKDLFSFANELPEEYIVISLKAPHAMQPSGNAWYAINFDAQKGKFSDIEQAILSRELVKTFLEEAIEAYPIDKNKVSLLGFSQGTILSFALALSYPEVIKNVIGLSGYVDTNMIEAGYESKDFSHLKVYNSHGSVDQVIPVEWARQNKPLLEKLNIDTVYEEYPVGHGINPQNFQSLKNWLKAQH
ncbi:phospholipase [Psychroflexus gondwanensis]|jgi:phospholipase/carboxylesterase|uniref:Esterase, putative n=1 Tax=Psychroflexus gondwanensis ACAM 44 TaxID=1189619 RepID=N1X0M4_9FLAO|nr:alpha/beta hydrolase-fold protein [Psychroflexus gondwanensis]EMY81583.1 esterase, putative [Psychroflexus gondwanensis ACAM 44]TXE20950.1 phospholipase [Psychroflexus gondwanensis]